MIAGLPLAFAQPWLLTALVLLPAIWWLLRFTPPRPVRVAFPPTRILLEIEQREDAKSRTPWWLVLLRMLIAALVIIALARPILNPQAVTAGGDGPILVVVDNGWGATPNWSRISGTADEILAEAGRDGRPSLLVATATDAVIGEPVDSDAAREKLAGLSVQPHEPDRAAIGQSVTGAVERYAIGEVVWLSDGLEYGDGEEFASALEAAGAETVEVAVPETGELPLALGPAVNETGSLTVSVLRADADSRSGGTIRARDLKGRVISETPYVFEQGAGRSEAAIDLPVELRNDIARLEIAEEETAGGVQLLDDRWRRRVIGLVSGETRERAQPLLSPLYYITRALAPFADLRESPDPNLAVAIDRLIQERVSILVLADIGTLIGDAHEQIDEWVDAGGVLVRFAGPRLAGADADSLVPVELRGGDRSLGGTLSWSEPQPLAAFPEGSPFAGLPVPPDVRVTRQVLAEPSIDLVEKTWASLEDGTPLVTAIRHGNGWIVLFHVTADAAWSNLPLSGVFVEMLRRIVDLAGASEETAGASRGVPGGILRPIRTLDATGLLGSPPPYARPIPSAEFADARPEREHPPGLYGEPDAFRSLNVMDEGTPFSALEAGGLTASTYPAAEPRSVGPWLLAAAVLLLIADGIAVLMLSGRGLHVRRMRQGATAALLALAVLGAPADNPAHAQSEAGGLSQADRMALEATLTTRLAYVRTGNAEIDETSRAGLEGLTAVLTERTALEPDSPIGVDIVTDELAFFPLLYWPIDSDAEPPAPEVLAKIDAYMKQGGTILFDTRDELEARPGSDGSVAGPGMLRLRTLLRGLDIPELEPVPADHVLTKAFYLLQDFPGRWEGGPLWVEAALRNADEVSRPARNADGVSAIMITSNDLAGAWATGDDGRPLYPVAPGGDLQREMAYRSGVNIVMYTLTGNYKADQVHVPALLERLGQ
ncbi:DUF4159 domain-containing protein [Microbaculum marinum]|uniref:DUF4159 domain-containing protein n=1 Tax=Microbaculum marinum TaxID=1764581 RepID=A0AAW9RPK4_9HYPH